MDNIDFGNYREVILFAAIENGNCIDDNKIIKLQEGLSDVEKEKFRVEFEEMFENQTLSKSKKIKGLYLVTTLGKMVAEEGGFNVMRLPVFSKTEKEKSLSEDKSELVESLLITNKKYSESLRANKVTQGISIGVAIGGFLALCVQIYFNVFGISEIQGSVSVPEITELKQIEIKESNTNLLLSRLEELEYRIDSLQKVSQSTNTEIIETENPQEN